jgi:hypothetical protein
MEQSTIAVSKTTKSKWESYKNHPNESFEAMFNRILQTVYDEDERLNKDDLKEIKLAMADFENNRFTTNKDVRKELKL